MRRLFILGVALVLSVSLGACSGISSGDVGKAARTAVTMAQQAADLTGNEQLKSVLSPVVKLLNTSEKQVAADNIPAATSTMSTFKGLWDTAAPVVKLAAGDNYALIDKDTAMAALKGLVGPLTALLG